MEGYQDSYGLYHPNKGFDSENGIKVTFEVFDWREEKAGSLVLHNLIFEINQIAFYKLCKLHELTPGVFLRSPWDHRKDNHDNTTSIVAGSRKYALDFHRRIKILGHYWHPRDVLYYNWMKGGINRALIMPFWPLIIPIQAFGCWKPYKVRGGHKIVYTDSKLLAKNRYKGARDSWVMKISHALNKALLKRHKKVWDYGAEQYVDISTFEKCAQYYYKEPGQPIRQTLDPLCS